MAPRHHVDWINWKLYRRAWLLCLLAFLVVLATSFRPQSPPQPSLEPTFTNEQAARVIERAVAFDAKRPDRRPGLPGANDSAQDIADMFREISAQNGTKLEITTVPHTTVTPHSHESISLVNVMARLPGRSHETVVIYAHRDNWGKSDRSSGAATTMALLELAREFTATPERVRTYLFVSTDGATQGAAGARALAEELQRKNTDVIATIGLDRIAAGDRPVYVPLQPSGHYAPPLGLTVAARDSVMAEVGALDLPAATTQMLRLGTPITLLEQGQLLSRGIPAITLTTADERIRLQRDADKPDPAALGASVRALQRLTGTLDGVNSLQSAGKTYVLSEQRVYRGWALKILVASLLAPYWIVVVDMLARMRRRWNLVAALGSVSRAMMGGLWVLASLWLLGAMRLFPAAGDRPPNPDALDDVAVLSLVAWVVLGVAGWMLSRGPDWRYGRHDGRDQPVIGVGLAVLGVIVAMCLAANPFAVVFLVPALHAWLWLASRHVHGAPAVIGVWAAGLLGPLGAGVFVAASFDVGIGAPWYWVELVQTRTLPPSAAMLLACAGGIGTLLLIAARGKVGQPAIVRIREHALRARALGSLGRPSLPALPSLPTAQRMQAPRDRASRLVRKREKSR